MVNLKSYVNKRILITGGLGFIGSTLVHRLVELGAKVTLVDCMLPRQGGNLFNIHGIEPRVQVNFSDVRDALSMNHLVQGQDVVFHLAGQVNHIDSIKNPLNDLDINCRGTLVVLEACRQHNPKARVVFTGTRGQYGSSVRLPVDEDHPMNPKGIYAVTNMACEKMMQVYHEVHGIPTVCLRLTNTYGPRHQMAHNEYGVLNWFIRRALDGQPIELFGDGRILRDFLYVDDAAESLLLVGLDAAPVGQIFNIGTGKPTTFIELARIIVEQVEGARYTFTEFTKERKELEPGDYYANCQRIRQAVGWQSTTPLERGIRQTLDYYRLHKSSYWNGPTTSLPRQPERIRKPRVRRLKAQRLKA